ncbi:lumazine synthase [Phytophthora pseudosyringae]|uniref:Lumazine synthase n=1 Tax=Phytophthora pseudosyringae TaxID=221518 RepID=A0A8T1WL08_9STRA|nr:lumazine synthase [Phytophthora pseudosyringae]
MAPGVEKTTSKMKFATKEEHPAGASHGQGGLHSLEEGKTHSSVLIEQPGATKSSKLDGSGLRVTIVASRWFEKVVHTLVDACSEELLAKGVAEDDLHLVEVAGAFELPYAAARLVHCKDSSHRPDAVVCIGCIVNDTTHMWEMMGHAVANAIMKLNVTSDTPVIYGVLCCDSEPQAHSSSGAGEDQKCNHGVAWAQSALEMAHLKRCASAKKAEHCSCTRCVSRGGGETRQQKHGSTKRDVCTTCGSPAKECSCKDCKCQVCCDHRGECASCKSSAANCSCKNCKCRSCCAKHEACRGCGCPPDKCSCEGCNCAVCSNKKEAAGKMPKPSSGEHAATHQSKHPTKHEAGVSSGGIKQGGPSECVTCGSPGGQCKCGLLH